MIEKPLSAINRLNMAKDFPKFLLNLNFHL